MGNISINVNKIRQDYMNNITQTNSQQCVTNTNVTASGNVITSIGNKISGNFTGINQAVGTDSTCLITNSMTSNINNILDAMADQQNKSSTGLFNDFTIGVGVNVYDIKQSTVNNLTQINSSLCASDTLVAANNNFIYVKDNEIGGNFVGISSNTNASSQCTMNNTMNMVVYNQTASNSTQTNSTMSVFVWIVIVLGVLFGLLIIGFIIFVAVGGVGAAVVASKKASQSQNADETEVY
jgi:hypothetical protein